METSRERLLVVKVGGGAITDKGSPVPRLLEAEMAAVVAALSEVWRERRGGLVVVIGAGSFGHGLARAAGFSSGGSGVEVSEKTLVAAARVRQQVRGLAREMEERMLAEGIPVWPCGCEEEAKKVQRAEGVPLLHGDMVIEQEEGKAKRVLRVMSGDTIAARMAGERGRLVFISGHALHRQDPKTNSTAPIVGRISRAEMREMMMEGAGAENNDATGAMRGKLEEVLAWAEPGVEVVICPVARATSAMRGAKENNDDEENGFTTIC